MRREIIEGALTRYAAGQDLPGTPERIRELAAYIDGHLAPRDMCRCGCAQERRYPVGLTRDEIEALREILRKADLA